MEHATIIGIDLVKHSFQLHGARADGSVAFRRKLSRFPVNPSTRNRPLQGTHSKGRQDLTLFAQTPVLPAKPPDSAGSGGGSVVWIIKY